MLVSGSVAGVPAELLWELAEGMSYVVAVDSGADWCLAAGLVPDCLIGDMDSVRAETRALLAAQDVEELVFERDKDATDLELALELLLSRGFTDLVATNVLHGRLDHELAALGNLADAGTRGMAVTLVEPTQTIIFMNNPGARSELRLRLGQNLGPDNAPPVSLIAWGGGAIVSASGFKWPLDQATLQPNSSLGVSNVPITDEPLIRLWSGALLVVVQTPAI